MLSIDRMFSAVQHVLPQHLISRLAGKLAETRIKPIKNTLIRAFIDIFNVNMSEAIRSKPEDFEHFNDFFTRALKSDARPLEQGNNLLLSPCDGVISEMGAIDNGSIMQAKGQYYSLISLLAGDAELCNQYLGGNFMTIYLSPKDYHRVHMPINGKLISMTYVPGKLFSVNQATASQISGLFTRNERLICHFETQAGPMIMILVGAMIVAAIETTWAGQVTPQKRTVQTTNYQSTSDIQLSQGHEMGRFKLGSTVILLFPEQCNQWKEDLTTGCQLQMGQSIGHY